MKVITANTVTVFKDLIPHQVDSTHPCFCTIKELALEDKEEEALELMSLKDQVAVAVEGTGLYLNEDDQVVFNGRAIPQLLAERVLDLMKLDLSMEYLENFLENLFLNPSYRAVEELYGFLQATNLPITKDGCFVAYKKVSHDMKDCHTNSMDNSVGQVLEMPRNEVDENCERTCSAGLHFASYNYANSFMTGILIAVKINPKDVVAIPTDYQNQKGRCCKYEVMEVLESDSLADRPVYDRPKEVDDEADQDWEDADTWEDEANEDSWERE